MATAYPPSSSASGPQGFAPKSGHSSSQSHTARRRLSNSARSQSSHASGNAASNAVAHTLTACIRCRQRKTRCDPGLPRCGLCKRTNSRCEYYDHSKGEAISRSYVVWLQHRVRDLEQELNRVENDDGTEDPEAMMRAATVWVNEAEESKYLGPSSGIAITRLVMQLAKQFTDAKSIKDIVPEFRAMQIKELNDQEQAKPTSKIYPLISDVPAPDLPREAVRDLLVEVYKLKVQIMYPALHEPTLDKDIAAVYAPENNATPYQHFICRMVLAIGLQKWDAHYAGLADSWYLAALQYLEPVVQAMDLKTLQCFALMAEYSLLTPTRTAIYYVVGIAVRLSQALGLNEEKTIVRGAKGEERADPLEIDMRRRLFWCIHVMEFGLSHSLGRPAILATRQKHFDVGWFETCDDEFITPNGIAPEAERPTLKKWIAIHFFKMRLLQLEIRRKLYLRKRSTPRNDSDEWFVQMHAKLLAWRDAAPWADEQLGLDNKWFVGRFNTMIVFLYRPSPQVPRPSLEAALKCFDACEYNIYVQREQIRKRFIDITWIFTQSIFMAINTMLWSLSYDEVRRRHNREAVEKHLSTAIESISLASDRWPGVASAIQLYNNLIRAIMQIYEKDGDIPLSAASPSFDNATSPPPGTFFDPQNRSRTTSPATASSITVGTPPEQRLQQQQRKQEQPPQPVHYQSEYNNAALSTPTARPAIPYTSSSNTSIPQMPTVDLNAAYVSQQYPQNPQYQYQPQNQFQDQQQKPLQHYYNPYVISNSLPDFGSELIASVPGWTPQHQQQQSYHHHQQQSFSHQNYPNLYSTTTTAPSSSYANNPIFNPNNPAYPFPATTEGPHQSSAMNLEPFMDSSSWGLVHEGATGQGLNQIQQQELMQSLETQGLEGIRGMISSTRAAMGSISGSISGQSVSSASGQTAAMTAATNAGARRMERSAAA